MTKATIQSVRQTEKAGLFTICFEGESFTEFQKFIVKGHENATLQPDLQKILNALQVFQTRRENARPSGGTTHTEQ